MGSVTNSAGVRLWKLGRASLHEYDLSLSANASQFRFRLVGLSKGSIASLVALP